MRRRDGGALASRAPIPNAIGAAIAAVALGVGGFVGARAKRSGESGDGGERSDGARRLDAFDRSAAGATKPTGAKAKLLELGRRHRWRWLGRTLELLQRYKELRGSSLAAAIALRAFVSLFPLLLLATAVAGFSPATAPTSRGASSATSA